MKRERITIKKRIAKKIEFRNKQVGFIGVQQKTTNDDDMLKEQAFEKKKRKQMDELDRLRIYGDGKKPVNVSLLSRDEMRTGVKIKEPSVVYEIKDYGIYKKQELIDYDVIIYVSSYNRCEKLVKLLKQLYSQESYYSYKIIIMNDGSTDSRYSKLKKNYPKAIYLKNEVNGGREFYWQTTNTIFNEIKKFDSHAVIQIDDDFILCNGFINKLMNKFFDLKKENNSYMGIRYHIGSFNENDIITKDYYDRTKRFQAFDGGSLFDIQFLKLINFKIKDDISINYKYNQSHVWNNLNNFAKNLGVMIYTTENSLAVHDDGGFSKMHPEYGIKRKIHTKNFIDDTENNT